MTAHCCMFLKGRSSLSRIGDHQVDPHAPTGDAQAYDRRESRLRWNTGHRRRADAERVMARDPRHWMCMPGNRGSILRPLRCSRQLSAASPPEPRGGLVPAPLWGLPRLTTQDARIKLKRFYLSMQLGCGARQMVVRGRDGRPGVLLSSSWPLDYCRKGHPAFPFLEVNESRGFNTLPGGAR